MSEKQKWYEHNSEAGVEIGSDPAEDAKRAERNIKARTTPQTIERGVTRVGGGDHGKKDKGVKRLGR